MRLPVLAAKSIARPVFGGALALALAMSITSPAQAGWGGWKEHGTHLDVQSESGNKQLKIARPAVWKRSSSSNKEVLHVVSVAERTQHAKDEVKLSTALKADAGFKKRFGSIIPTTTIAKHNNWMEQSDRPGTKFRDLRDGDKDFAASEMQAAIAMAEKVLGQKVSHEPSNFVFERNGKIRGWFSLVDSPEGKAFPIEMVKEFTAGANATAFQVKSTDARYAKYGVVKILKTNEPRRLPADGSDIEMTELSLEAQYLSEVVGKNKKILKRFGNIIPKTLAIAPGVILQELAQGAGLEELSSKQRDVAKKDITDFVEMAKKILPGVVVSKHSTNFRFDKETGKMVSAYDIPSDGPRSYEKVNQKARFYIYKTAAESKKSFEE